MIKVVGVRFKNTGKMYYFDPMELDIKSGMGVIVETARGIEFGNAVSDIKEIEEDEAILPLKNVIRIATQEDIDVHNDNVRKEKEAFDICIEKIAKHELDMKLIDVEYTFDGNKILFYFVADTRIDFRELVKDLASVFKTRIELRQVGVRDQAKAVGGLGICGRVICCASATGEFQPVSIKMAKEQGLSLSPTKISGTCGRLMCCLKHEQEAYEDAIKRMPGVGSIVETPEGTGVVTEVNLLRENMKVRLDKETETDLLVCSLDEVKILEKKRVVTSSKHDNNDGEDIDIKE